MFRIKLILSILVVCLLMMNCSEKKKEQPKSKPAVAEKKVEPQKEETKAEVKKEEPKKAEGKEEVKDEPKKEEKEEPKVEPVTQEQLDKAADIIKSVSKSDIAGVNAKKVYKMRCASCHGFKGDMKVNGAKDLTKSKVSMEESVAQVYFGRGLMTPFKGLMKDEEIVAVAEYIRDKLRK